MLAARKAPHSSTQPRVSPVHLSLVSPVLSCSLSIFTLPSPLPPPAAPHSPSLAFPLLCFSPPSSARHPAVVLLSAISRPLRATISPFSLRCDAPTRRRLNRQTRQFRFSSPVTIITPPSSHNERASPIEPPPSRLRASPSPHTPNTALTSYPVPGLRKQPAGRLRLLQPLRTAAGQPVWRPTTTGLRPEPLRPGQHHGARKRQLW